MDILDDIGLKKISAKVFFKVNYVLSCIILFRVTAVEEKIAHFTFKCICLSACFEDHAEQILSTGSFISPGQCGC